jgi:hypothetical protein
MGRGIFPASTTKEIGKARIPAHGREEGTSEGSQTSGPLVGQREENGMYELAEYEVLQTRDERGRQVAAKRPTKMALEYRETRPYVVRDLSWELARYLDAEDSSEGAPATPNTASGN